MITTFNPIVSYAVVTDQMTRIAYGPDKKAIIFGEGVSKSTRMLDSAILKDFINQLGGSENILFVCGGNTHRDLEKSSIELANVLSYSGPDSGVAWWSDYRKPTESTPIDYIKSNTNLIQWVHAKAIQDRLNILVMGGSRMYSAFAGYYDVGLWNRIECNEVLSEFDKHFEVEESIDKTTKWFSGFKSTIYTYNKV